MSSVWVVVADFGMNGVDVLGVYDQKPDKKTLAMLKLTSSDLNNVTGYQGVEVLERSLLPQLLL